MTNVDLPSVTAAQAPGFQRVRIGDLLITALYDGFGAIPAEDLRGGTPESTTKSPAAKHIA
jgi:hypothetical protein